MVLNFVPLRSGQRAACLRGKPVCDEPVFVVAEYDVLKATIGECGGLRGKELELELYVVWCGEFSAENVEVELLAVVAATQSDEETLKPLLPVQNKALLLVVVRYLEVAEMVPLFLLEVVNEFASADSHVGLPDQQGADGVLPENGIEKPADLILWPDERALYVREPETTVFIWIVQIGHNLSE
jgi:hypothetical protein